MRTKALLCAAAFAASVAASKADNVYSLNIVGYVNVPVVANSMYLLGNPLNTSDGLNNVSNVITTLPDSFDTAYIAFWDGTTLQPEETWFAGYGWYPATTALPPGQGFAFFTLGGSGTITFVGQVQTNYTASLVPGINLIASAYPASLSLTALGLVGWNDTDYVARQINWTATSLEYDNITYFQGYGWYDNGLGDGGPITGPNLGVAEGVYYWNAGATPVTWTQNFNP